MSDDFERYVKEILRAIPKDSTSEQFDRATRIDRAAGYDAEVDEAKRRFFLRTEGAADDHE